MAGSMKSGRGRMALPRNWRVIIVASATTLGLACGAAQPALGEWFKGPRDKQSTSTSAAAEPKSKAPENGFAATIRRLMSDSRQYAERGDLDKAVQLAERAAKISEASSQLLGPASDCSPEVTARFANEIRSRRDAAAKKATRTEPVQVATARPEPRVPTAAFPPASAAPPLREKPESRPVEKTSVAAAAPNHPLDPNSKDDFNAIQFERPIFAGEQRQVPQPADEVQVASRSELPEWSEDLPPTPAPARESASKRINFRRSVLVRAGHSTDEPTFESQPVSADPIAAAAKQRIEEALDADFAAEPLLDDAATIPDPALASTKSAPRDVEVLLEDDTPQDDGPKLDGSIQPVAAEVASEDAAFDLAPPSDDPRTDDAATEADPPNKALVFASEKADREVTQPRPVSAPVEPPAAETAKAEQDFPVHRVVQLRRRLEAVASFNPGGAYLPPTPPPTKPDFAASSAGSQTAEKSRPTTDLHAPPSNREEGVDVGHEPSLPIRLRERHSLVEGTLTNSLLVPAPPAPRRSAVGHSEPILWHSAIEGHAASAGSPSVAVLQEGRYSRSAEGSANRKVLKSEHVAPVEQAGFRMTDPLQKAASDTEINGPALTSPADAAARRLTLDDPASGAVAGSLSNLDEENLPWVVSRQSDRSRAAHHKTNATHEVRKQSFAAIEQLASTLKLPVATTASMLGSAGLALLGLGLLLVRAALRWRKA